MTSFEGEIEAAEAVLGRLMTFAEKLPRYQRYLETHNVYPYSGALIVRCPGCRREHSSCEFTAGSLWCRLDPCGNPHCHNLPDRVRSSPVFGTLTTAQQHAILALITPPRGSP